MPENLPSNYQANIEQLYQATWLLETSTCTLTLLAMADKGVLFGSSCVLLAVTLRRRRRRRRNRVVWTKKWIQNRKSQGAFHQLLKELQQLDTSSYKNFVRMDAATFEELLLLIAPKITKKDTVMREAISPGERLAVTLRFLATGKLYSK